jgi:uncharacterized protein YjdB
LRGDYNGGPQLNSSQPISDFNIKHVVYTRNAAGAEKIYINGIEAISGVKTGNFSSWSNDFIFLLANEWGTSPRVWLGDYYLVAVFNRALSPSEVQGNFNAGYFAGQSIEATGISLSTSSLVIQPGETFQINASLIPSNAFDVISWSSGSPSVASIDQNGNVTALLEGTCNIIATTNGITAECIVTVKPQNITGTLTIQHWNDIPGNFLNVLQSDPDFPNNPDQTGEISVFDGPKDIGSNFGTRILGYVIPKASGSYVFWISGDDESELYLSTDDSPANKTSIAHIPLWTNYLTWDKYPTQKSATIELVAGKHYYIEALHKEHGGGDHVSVAWEQPGIPREIIGSKYISKQTLAPAIPVQGISLQNSSLSLQAGDTLSLIAQITPANATDKAVTWISSNASIAMVNESGLVTALATGTANISATTNDGNFSAQCAVSVLQTTQTGRNEQGIIVKYNFLQDPSNLVRDVSGVGDPLDLTIMHPNNVSWLPGQGLKVNSATTIYSTTSTGKIVSACKATNEITIEAWIRPVNATLTGPARIVSLSTNISERNFTLGQSVFSTGNYQFATRLRTDNTNGSPDFVSNQPISDFTLKHVVYTRDMAGNEKYYVNGIQTNSGTRAGNFSLWTNAFVFLLANEWGTSPRAWFGDYYLVAVFNRALSSNEVQGNFNAGYVAGPANEVIGITLSTPSLVLQPGETFQIKASLMPANAFGVINWSSGSPTVASIDQNGNVTALQEGSCNIMATTNGITAECIVTVKPQDISGTLTIQHWNDIPGNFLNVLQSDPDFPNNPDQTGEISVFDGPKDIGSNFGTRIVGYIIPKASGNYLFWISGDDECKLFLSTDESPVNKIQIASVPGYSGFHVWDKYPDQNSSAISLVAGKHYYIEALHKEGAGGDHVSVAWSGPGMVREVIGSNYLSTRLPYTQTGAVTGILVSQSLMNIPVNQSAQLTATIIPNNATNQSISWSSSSPSMATVDQNGHVTGMAQGSASISVTSADGGFTANCLVTVYPITPPKELAHKPQYNGNISAIKWASADGAGNSQDKLYAYGYDNLNRLTNAYYAEKAEAGSWTKKAGGFNVEDIGYDMNGNIQALRRYTHDTHTKILDQLDYQYHSSNQLASVTDLGGDRNKGFKDGYVGLDPDYEYDDNGNMYIDRNKGIENITYNHLNLPSIIEFSGYREIRYTYDAAGIKLKKEVYRDGQPVSATHYINGIEYKTVKNEPANSYDTYLDFIHTGEGRAVPKEDGTFLYEYFIKDHLGNVRATIASEKTTIDFEATLEDKAKDEAEGFKNIESRHLDQINNHTPGGTYAAYLNPPKERE